MATDITLINLTEQGVKTIKDLPARLSAGRQAMEANGGKLLQYYLTLGAQDAVVITELPDDETAASVALQQAGLGNLRTTTMRAFTEAEIPGVLSKMP
ncbi:MAG: GYD domain-containing protein [Pseudomonadales bacterium]|nr:GYD domain-containing protein [Pseudomonadales bacterium]